MYVLAPQLCLKTVPDDAARLGGMMRAVFGEEGADAHRGGRGAGGVLCFHSYSLGSVRVSDVCGLLIFIHSFADRIF